jgi:hypothetical protein
MPTTERRSGQAQRVRGWKGRTLWDWPCRTPQRRRSARAVAQARVADFLGTA